MPHCRRDRPPALSARRRAPDPQPLVWDDGEPWKLWLEVRQDERDQWNITGSLRRGEERMELQRAVAAVEGGFLVLARASSRRWTMAAPSRGSRA